MSVAPLQLAGESAGAAYTRLWPLSRWATVTAGSSGVTYTEESDGITWTVAAGAANVSDPTTTWYATGPLATAVPVIGTAATWADCEVLLLLMRRAAITDPDLYVEMYVHNGDFTTAANNVYGISYRRTTVERIGVRRRSSSTWAETIGHADAATRGCRYPLGAQRNQTGTQAWHRFGNVEAVNAANQWVANSGLTDDSNVVALDTALPLNLTVTVGRLALTSASGTIRMAPQVLGVLPRVAQEGA